jgi:lipopolysaccharide/colanic/teichoic acid biosynthesis glycosyltransferase
MRKVAEVRFGCCTAENPSSCSRFWPDSRKSPNNSSANTIDWVFNFHPQKVIFRGEAYLIVKRLLDLLLVIGCMPFWLPILAVCGFLVKLEYPSAKSFFAQKRTGKDGKMFRMFKLRTMVPNAEELKKELAHLNELKYPDFKIKNDPRITRLGHFLRKTSLDELPQLINVILGDMSLVGPRPTSFRRETYQLWHTERLDVIPGLTGLWQISGRGTSEFDERLRLDILYIQRRSIALDIQVILRTFASVLFQQGAH